MRLLHNLLPLLRESSFPRVLSVLNGGKEDLMDDDDLGLEKKWSMLGVVGHSTTMTTLAFEYLASLQENRNVTLLHSYPGWVRTDNFSRLSSKSASLVWAFFLRCISGIIHLLVLSFGISAYDCGQRQVFYLTSTRYGPGVWRINHLSETEQESKVIRRYLEANGKEMVWSHTESVFGRLRQH
jgi:hypothetical protein